MLAKIKADKSTCKVYAIDQNDNTIEEYTMSTAYYPGYNEYGQERSNAEDGIYPIEWIDLDYDNDCMLPSYGWAYINIDNRGRAFHGGGSNLGEPDCYDPYQPLLPTYGCFRMYNHDVWELAHKAKDSLCQGYEPVIEIVS